jgi:ribonuclease E
MNDEPTQAPVRDEPAPAAASETPAPPETSGSEGGAAGSSSGSAGSANGSGEGSTTTTGAPRRRRSRGGRGRGGGSRPRPATAEGDGEEAGSGADDGGSPTAGAGTEEEASKDEKPRTSAAKRSSSRSSSGTRSTTGRSRAKATEPEEGADDTTRAAPDGGSDAEDRGSDDDGGLAGTGTSSSARRRRRRGGRGRGGRGGGSGGAGTSTAEAGDDTDGAGTGEAATEAADGGEAAASTADGQKDGPAARSRSRSRSRSRGSGSTKAKTAAAEDGDAADTDQAPAAEVDTAADGAKTTTRRRRRSGSGAKAATGTSDTGEGKAKATTTRSRAKPKGTSEEPLPEPTRTSRRRRRSDEDSAPTRTRRGTTRRRRDPIPLIKRTQDKVMVITEHGDRDQIAVMEDRALVEHYITRAGAHSMVGNIYLGRVQNVLPGMEAAFIDVGRGRNAVLYAGEVNYDDADLEGGQRRIEHVLKAGQPVLVQVTKDPIGGKGARLTAQVSLPGRYVVLVPDSQVFGISRRLPDEERRRLRGIIKQVRPEQHGVIVRTAAEGASEEALKADVERLIKAWASIEKDKKKQKAPAVIYEEPELTVRVVRDLFTDEEFKQLVTDSRRIHDQVRDYLSEVAPDLVEKVTFYEGTLPLFEEFHATEQIHKALDRKVWLPSGGYIIIERVEAMTVIDVNTGKHVGKTNLEETVVKTNLEAADEIARQLRLRDIGGIIIIDFIDMLLERNRDKIVDALKEAMAHDKTRSQVFDITPLGLLEVTRKRVSAGLLESFSETCPTCEGRGILLTHQI